MENNSKFIVFSDLHIHNYRNYDVDGSRLRNCLNVLKDIFEYADEHKISIILFCGDLYDSQKSLPIEVVNETVKTFDVLFKQFPKIDFIAISGNHDHSGKNTIKHKAHTSLEHLSNIFNNFKLVDNSSIYIESDYYFTGIPYYTHRQDFENSLNEITIHDDANMYLMIHQTPEMANSLIPHECSTNDFKEFDFVFCGHIHKHQRLADNFVVVGSPLHRDLGDEGQEKGFLVFDTEVNDYEFIPLNYPKFSREPKDKDYAIPLLETKEYSQQNFNLNNKPLELLREYSSKINLDDETLELGEFLISN